MLLLVLDALLETIYCHHFSRNVFFSFVLLTDQVSLSDWPVLQLLISQVVTS